MICFIALPVLVILGIFSASQRKLAWEAIDCVLRRVTLRKCHSRLDQRLKSQITGKIMKRSPSVAKIIYKYFEWFSYAFLILFLVSGFYSVQGGYNYIVHGHCAGPQGEGFCIFDPFGGGAEETCSEFSIDYTGQYIPPGVDDDPSIGEGITVIEFGCYTCPYTAKAQPLVKKMLDEYKGQIQFVFRDFPLDNHGNSTLVSEAANCVLEQSEQEFWRFHSTIFNYIGKSDNREFLVTLAEKLEIDLEKYEQCFDEHKYDEEVAKDKQDGINAQLMGTPTFFIGDEVIVGPQDYSVFKEAIEKALNEN